MVPHCGMCLGLVEHPDPVRGQDTATAARLHPRSRSVEVIYSVALV
jgi:hypothetical protein